MPPADRDRLHEYRSCARSDTCSHDRDCCRNNPPAVPSWAGTWNTTWLNTDGNLTVSVVTMAQSGPEVTGNYSFTYPDEGTFTGHLNGTAKGQTLAGMYSESDDDIGYIIFALSADGNSFTGRWVHAANQSDLDTTPNFWNGVRMAP